MPPEAKRVLRPAVSPTGAVVGVQGWALEGQDIKCLHSIEVLIVAWLHTHVKYIQHTGIYAKRTHVVMCALGFCLVLWISLWCALIGFYSDMLVTRGGDRRNEEGAAVSAPSR